MHAFPRSVSFTRPYSSSFSIPCKSWRRAISQGSHKARVVVLGSGWAGYRVAKDLDKAAYHVTMVSPRNHFLFTPLLASTTTGTLEFRSIIEPVRKLKGVKYYQAKCRLIDPDQRIIRCASVFHNDLGQDLATSDDDRPMFNVPYDHLVLAVGAHAQTFGIEGVLEHATFLKSIGHAQHIRRRIIMCLERASEPYTTDEQRDKLLSFVVVGGGPTGVEFAGELYDFIHQDGVRSFGKDLCQHVRVSVVEASSSLLSGFDVGLAKYTKEHMRNHNIEVLTNVRVEKVLQDGIVTHGGEIIPFGLCVWSTGISPTRLIASLDWEKDNAGRIVTDECCKALGKGDIFAIGDSAVIRDAPLAATAQVANQKGKYVASHLNGLAGGRAPKPFSYAHRGMLAYVGDYAAVSDLPQVKLKGISSWLFWRSAYLTSLVSISNKVLVPMHWFKSFVFGRDTSLF